MSQIKVKLAHSEALKFAAELPDGRRVELDSSEKMEKAFTPMELFLFALAGCTAMDVQWIMERQRQKVDKFEISVNGTRREEDPRYYETIDLEYALQGQELRKDAVERAIRLSQEEYCSVRAMLNNNVKFNIIYTIQTGNELPQKYTYSPKK
ncbi:MAG TPA: OsmC family protein [Terriglobales bacterium]|nr:OsmC family protein [Terriglobales bacterium]